MTLLKEDLWHRVTCDQIGLENPTCKCSDHNHHVGAFLVAQYLGMTKQH